MHSGPSDRCAPRSKWISLHGPHGPVSAIRQKLLSSPASTSPQIGHPLRRQPDLVAPDLPGDLVVLVGRRGEALGRDAQVAGQEVPREVDRLALEVVAEAPVAEHLEERVVARASGRPPRSRCACRRRAGRAGSRPRGCSSRVSAPVRTSLNWTIPEFVKSSVWSPAGTRLALGHGGVAALLEELDEAPPDLGRGQRLDPRIVLGDGGRHRPQWYRTGPARASRRSGRAAVSSGAALGCVLGARAGPGVAARSSSRRSPRRRGRRGRGRGRTSRRAGRRSSWAPPATARTGPRRRRERDRLAHGPTFGRRVGPRTAMIDTIPIPTQASERRRDEPEVADPEEVEARAARRSRRRPRPRGTRR